ncbi:activator of HSP90 ATPase [Leptobacterium flavescens]|uniref:Activator of HSP90 ATPase n=1 Tax=Leptobacterium flavescens TaxID=472055 RepID=A0A6P0UHH5_9FLAO|nr:SRPBCC domain-containing protein [Leptobacterium flavescens]NER12082.1 activator of HSP90 ATPase [Leptobacterium flavescens]
MNETNQLDNRTLSLKRTFNAPVELVWEAWTRPDHIAQWWGPKGMETRVVEHDFRPGGKWEYVMIMPDGKEFITNGRYLEIVEFEKIISSADFKPMTEGVEIQAFFEADGDKTNFTFKVVHPTEEYCRQQEKMGFMNGWGSVFDRLNEFLTTD